MSRLTRGPERLVHGAARGMTRRRLLRRAGSVALGAAVTTAYLGRGGSEVAVACTNPSPCFGAPLCGGHRCNGYLCRSGRADTNYMCYAAYRCCGNAGVDNCWEHTQTRTRCCDCCALNAGCTTGGRCSGCGGGVWHACICKGPY